MVQGGWEGSGNGVGNHYCNGMGSQVSAVSFHHGKRSENSYHMGRGEVRSLVLRD